MDQQKEYATGSIPVVPPVPPKPPVPSRTPERNSAMPEFPQHPERSDKPAPRKSPTRIILIAAAVVVVLALVLILLPKGESTSPLSDSLPTQRQMVSDAKTILTNSGLDCKVISLTVDDEALSERFKTYKADCTVTISVDGSQSTRELSLRYEYKNDQWQLVEK